MYYAKQKYQEAGVAGLLSQKGQGNRKPNIVPDDYYEYYKSLYLREGALSAFFCWQATLGYAKEKDNVDILKFPSYKTFQRLLKTRVPAQAIYMARFGNAAWNKKYASYIPRDYSTLRAGSCWVSDHAQIDVAVNFNGSVCFPCIFLLYLNNNHSSILLLKIIVEFHRTYRFSIFQNLFYLHNFIRVSFSNHF